MLAKARGVTDAFPFWITNYFTGYSEGGPDYIHALLTGTSLALTNALGIHDGGRRHHLKPAAGATWAPALPFGHHDRNEGAVVATTRMTGSMRHVLEARLAELDARTRVAWTSYRDALSTLEGAEYDAAEAAEWDQLQATLREVEAARADLQSRTGD